MLLFTLAAEDGHHQCKRELAICKLSVSEDCSGTGDPSSLSLWIQFGQLIYLLLTDCATCQPPLATKRELWLRQCNRSRVQRSQCPALGVDPIETWCPILLFVSTKARSETLWKSSTGGAGSLARDLPSLAESTPPQNMLKRWVPVPNMLGMLGRKGCKDKISINPTENECFAQRSSLASDAAWTVIAVGSSACSIMWEHHQYGWSHRDPRGWMPCPFRKKTH